MNFVRSYSVLVSSVTSMHSISSSVRQYIVDHDLEDRVQALEHLPSARGYINLTRRIERLEKIANETNAIHGYKYG